MIWGAYSATMCRSAAEGVRYRVDSHAMTEPSTVDEYMAGFPEDRRAVLEELRQTIRAARSRRERNDRVRHAGISNGPRDFLVSFAPSQRHDSFFPA